MRFVFYSEKNKNDSVLHATVKTSLFCNQKTQVDNRWQYLKQLNCTSFWVLGIGKEANSLELKQSSLKSKTQIWS